MLVQTTEKTLCYLEYRKKRYQISDGHWCKLQRDAYWYTKENKL